MIDTRYSEVRNNAPQHIELSGLMFYRMYKVQHMLLTDISKVIYL